MTRNRPVVWLSAVLGCACFAGVLSVATLACAQSAQPQSMGPIDLRPVDRRPYLFSLRPSLGVGSGSTGGGGRAGLSMEVWPAEHVGTGFLAAALEQKTQEDDFDESVSAWLLGPLVALRSSSHEAYAFGVLGAGWTQMSHSRTRSSCYGYCPQPTAADDVFDRHHGGWALDAALGWLGHPGGGAFEAGLAMRLDVLHAVTGGDETNTMVTVNLELGLAAKGH